MIATRRGLAVLVAIAIVLGALVAIDLARTPALVSRALVPDFDDARVTALAWKRPGQPDVRIVRAGGAARWTWDAPAGWAEPRTVADVLAALRGARWHRRADRARAGAVHATLTITIADAAPHVLGIGEPLAGSEQTWLVDDNVAVLVDSWVARALDPAALALRVRTPLADAMSARRIEVRGGALGLAVAIDGAQLVSPIALRVDPERVATLARALAALTVVRLPDRPIGAATGVRVTVAGDASNPDDAASWLAEAGGCRGAPTLVAITGPAGDGCVDAEAWRAVLDAAAAFGAPAAALVDRRPAALELAHATLVDGATLDLVARPRVTIAGTAYDVALDRVAGLRAALATPAAVAPLPTRPALGTLIVADRAGDTIALDLYAGALARHGEPIALQPTATDWVALTATGRALRDATLWLEDPLSITSITIDGITWTRGAVIGEWSRAPASPASVAAKTRDVERLARELATPKTVDADPSLLATSPHAHRVAFDVTAPSAPPRHRELAIGDAPTGACLVEVEGTVSATTGSLCTAVDTLAPEKPR